MYRSPYSAPISSLPPEGPPVTGGLPGGYQPFNPPPQPTEIQPGSITYTTTTSPDGRPVYQPFKAVPASYQTPNGPVSGIQWMPIEATGVVPAGAKPASPDFAAMWQRGGPGMSPQDERKIKDWQKAEEKRRRKEEKESQRALRDKDLYNRSPSAGPQDPELRKAREKDAQRAANRERRKSFTGGVPGTAGGPPFRSPTSQGAHSNPSTPFLPPNTSASPYVPPGSLSGYGNSNSPGGYPFPTANATPGAYPPSARGGSVHELSSQLGGMDLSASRDFEREKSPMARPKKYTTSTSPNETMADRARRLSGNFGVSGQPYPPAPSAMGSNTTPSPYPPFGAAPSGYPAFATSDHTSRSRGTTPAMVTGPLPPPQPGVVYPPAPGGMPTPSMPQQSLEDQQRQLPAPEGFSRPPNQAQPYTPFEMMKIKDMDDLLKLIPPMPLVLQTHDTLHEDWIRLMQDLSLAWAGRLPVPELARSGQYPRRSTLTADVIDLWNQSFFNPRGVDMILYKGRERRSGPQKGLMDLRFTIHDLDSDESSSSSGTSSDDDSDGDYPRSGGIGGGGAYGAFGGNTYGPSMDGMDARRRRERKMEKRRRRKEKRQRRKEKAREKTYAIYLTCIPPHPPLSSHAIPTPGTMAGYGPVSGTTY